MRDLPNSEILNSPSFYKQLYTPKPKTWENYLSREGLRKQPTQLKQFIPYFSKPGVRVLCGGLPHPNTFPFNQIKVTIQDMEIELDKTVLDSYLQYGAGSGHKGYIEAVLKIAEWTDNIPLYSDYSIMGTAGNTMSIESCLRMLLNEGDGILVEEYAYSSSLELMRHMGLTLIPIKMDEQGIIPSDIPSAMQRKKKRSRVLYLVPTGQNPTGANMTMERRKQLLQMAEEMDLIIIEDDPYSCLQYDNQEPSIVSLDTTGRVIYLHTFSKILAPNLRIGYLIANSYFVRKLIMFSESSIQQPCGVSQLIVTKMIEKWTKEQYLEFLDNTKQHYFYRRNYLVGLLKRYCKFKVHYQIPSSGMFVWLKIVGDSQQVFQKLLEMNVLVAPGSFFSAIPADSVPWFRLSFSLPSEEEMEQSIKLLAATIK